MARRNAANIQKAKEAKQKKVLLLLLPLFLLLVAWQGPKMYKALFAKPAPEATPVATTPSSTVPGAPTTASGAPLTGGLADSEPLPTARSDQLLSFSRFTARNPFVAPGGAAPLPSGTSELTNTAVIEVNGQSEEVVYGGGVPDCGSRLPPGERHRVRRGGRARKRILRRRPTVRGDLDRRAGPARRGRRHELHGEGRLRGLQAPLSSRRQLGGLQRQQLAAPS